MIKVKVQGKQKPVGFKAKTLSKFSMKRYSLKYVGSGEYWIQPQKLKVETMQAILEKNKMSVKPEELAGVESSDEIREKVKEKITKLKKNGYELLNDPDFLESIKMAVTEGVYDHNLDEPIYIKDSSGNIKTELYGICKEDADGQPLKDDNGDYVFLTNEKGEMLTEKVPVIKTDDNGKPMTKKMEWGEQIYNQLLEADNKFAILEIYKIVMDFNHPPGKKKKEKSET